tara:strand:+ start:32 stop:208 length:177 start_codon:yes stop_codon:yes gene_type:complete
MNKLSKALKRIADLEKRVDLLESKLESKKSSDLREEKWIEFQSVIRLQEKNNNRKSLN